MSSCPTPDKPRNQWYVNKMKEIKALNNLVGKFQQQQQSDQVSEMTESKASQGNETKETAPRGWGFTMFEIWKQLQSFMLGGILPVDVLLLHNFNQCFIRSHSCCWDERRSNLYWIPCPVLCEKEVKG